jgi:hypothetical protein
LPFDLACNFSEDCLGECGNSGLTDAAKAKYVPQLICRFQHRLKRAEKSGFVIVESAAGQRICGKKNVNHDYLPCNFIPELTRKFF